MQNCNAVGVLDERFLLHSREHLPESMFDEALGLLERVIRILGCQRRGSKRNGTDCALALLEVVVVCIGPQILKNSQFDSSARRKSAFHRFL